MARWEPNAAERLARAALDLFAERGYENTTVIDIAQRAGLGKTTFFRHFQDKREVLFGGGTMTGLLVEAIAAAPATAAPLEVIARALDAAGGAVFTPERREFIARRQAVIAANRELREREALKNLALIASMADALERRGVPDLTARVAAELGALASAIAYERWSRTTGDDDFGEIARQALDDVQASAALCRRDAAHPGSACRQHTISARLLPDVTPAESYGAQRRTGSAPIVAGPGRRGGAIEGSCQPGAQHGVDLLLGDVGKGLEFEEVTGDGEAQDAADGQGRA